MTSEAHAVNPKHMRAGSYILVGGGLQSGEERQWKETAETEYLIN